MPEKQKLIGPQARFVLSGVTSIGMFLLLAVASCTSTQDFNALYNQIMEWLSLSGSFLSLSLRASPGLGHFLCYAVLSFALSGLFSRRHIWIAPLLAVLFGVLMEIVQIYIPSRDANLMDVFINALGIAVGFGFYLLFVNYTRRGLRLRFD